jgi:hypothetical protein
MIGLLLSFPPPLSQEQQRTSLLFYSLILFDFNNMNLYEKKKELKEFPEIEGFRL